MKTAEQIIQARDDEARRLEQIYRAERLQEVQPATPEEAQKRQHLRDVILGETSLLLQALDDNEWEGGTLRDVQVQDSSEDAATTESRATIDLPHIGHYWRTILDSRGVIYEHNENEWVPCVLTEHPSAHLAAYLQRIKYQRGDIGPKSVDVSL